MPHLPPLGPPPIGRLRPCAGELEAEAVSGEGTVFAFTVNQHQFHPDVPPPNLIAIVELIEQHDLRIPTNIAPDRAAGGRAGRAQHVRPVRRPARAQSGRSSRPLVTKNFSTTSGP